MEDNKINVDYTSTTILKDKIKEIINKQKPEVSDKITKITELIIEIYQLGLESGIELSNEVSNERKDK